MSIRRVRTAAWLIQKLFAKSAYRFEQALQHPEKSQQQILQTITANLAKSLYGKHLKAQHIRCYETFAQVPIVNYDALTSWIALQRQGCKHVLTPQRVLMFEKTSGSSGASKYIPYNYSLLNSFNTMFQIWAYDILKNAPKLTTGRIFMSISPPANTGGFTNDNQYLKHISRLLLSPFIIYPPKYTAGQIDVFRYSLAATLLKEENLEVISVWNPTYLLILVDLIRNKKTDFLADGKLKKFISPARRNLLLQHPVPWQALWPHLKIISCWTSATAAYQAKKLAEYFPNVFMQGKGLLATEGPLTVPLINAPSYVPLLNEVFFEFVNKHGQIKLLHELHQQEVYKVIISQKGGLYRYEMNDKVKVMGHYLQTPCLEFIGRGEETCDLVGEKLTETFVADILQGLVNDSAYRLLVPSLNEQEKGQYILFTDNTCLSAKAVEQALCTNHHYHNARVLGQLSAIKIIHIENIAKLVHDFYLSMNMSMGNIKDKVLMTNLHQAEHLLAYFNKHALAR